MKILHINYSDSNGGAATACMRLVKALNKNLIHSKLLVNEKNTDINKDVILNLDNIFDILSHKIKKYLAIKIKKILGANNIFKDSISIFKSGLPEKINNFDCDIVNLHWICNEMISIEELKKIKKPKIWTIVDMWPFIGSSHYTENTFYKFKDKKFDKKKFFNIENWVLNRKISSFSNDIKIICISSWLKKLAIESKIFKENQIEVIPCTIDHRKWFPLNKDVSKKKLNFDNKKKYFLFSAYNGINDFRKGFDIFLTTIEKLNLYKSDFTIVILGNAEGLDNLKKKYNFDFIVYDKHFNDDIESLKLIYSACDLAIVPSRIEAFGQIVLEAGACELPCVTFKDIGTADIITHKEDGYLADYLDVEDLVNGINFCLNQNNYNKISKNIRNKIIEKFSYDVVAEKYEKVYRKLL